MDHCTQCYDQSEVVLWRDLPMNEEIRPYASTYISPVKEYFFTLDEATAIWGTTIQPEDLLLP